MPAPVVGPAPRMMARPVNFRKSERGRELISFALFCFFYCVFFYSYREERGSFDIVILLRNMSVE